MVILPSSDLVVLFSVFSPISTLENIDDRSSKIYKAGLQRNKKSLSYRSCEFALGSLVTHPNISQHAASLSTSCEQVVIALLAANCQQSLKQAVKKTCNNFVDKMCSHRMFQVVWISWNKLLTTRNNLDGTIRLVTRLFQQDWYSHNITISLQSCVVNFVITLLQQLCIRVVRTTLSKKVNRLCYYSLTTASDFCNFYLNININVLYVLYSLLCSFCTFRTVWFYGL